MTPEAELYAERKATAAVEEYKTGMGCMIILSWIVLLGLGFALGWFAHR